MERHTKLIWVEVGAAMFCIAATITSAAMHSFLVRAALIGVALVGALIANWARRKLNEQR